MNFLEPWNIFFFVSFFVFLCTRHVYQKSTLGQENVVTRVDTTEKVLLVAVTVACMLLPMLYLFTPVLSFADYQPHPLVPWLGCFTMLVTLWLFWRSHTDLGRNWSVSLEVRDGHQLVTHGVYRRVRHPMYASIWLWSIAQALLLRNWIAGCACLAAFGAMYFIRVPREEQMMLDSFGDQYRAYMSQTGRILPRLGSSSAKTERLDRS